MSGQVAVKSGRQKRAGRRGEVRLEVEYSTERLTDEQCRQIGAALAHSIISRCKAEYAAQQQA